MGNWNSELKIQHIGVILEYVLFLKIDYYTDDYFKCYKKKLKYFYLLIHVADYQINKKSALYSQNGFNLYLKSKMSKKLTI